MQIGKRAGLRGRPGGPIGNESRHPTKAAYSPSRSSSSGVGSGPRSRSSRSGRSRTRRGHRLRPARSRCACGPQVDPRFGHGSPILVQHAPGHGDGPGGVEPQRRRLGGIGAGRDRPVRPQGPHRRSRSTSTPARTKRTVNRPSGPLRASTFRIPCLPGPSSTGHAARTTAPATGPSPASTTIPVTTPARSSSISRSSNASASSGTSTGGWPYINEAKPRRDVSRAGVGPDPAGNTPRSGHRPHGDGSIAEAEQQPDLDTFWIGLPVPRSSTEPDADGFFQGNLDLGRAGSARPSFPAGPSHSTATGYRDPSGCSATPPRFPAPRSSHGTEGEKEARPRAGDGWPGSWVVTVSLQILDSVWLADDSAPDPANQPRARRFSC